MRPLPFIAGFYNQTFGAAAYLILHEGTSMTRMIPRYGAAMETRNFPDVIGLIAILGYVMVAAIVYSMHG
jgi:hypothetical protein